jgi:hypothetical protein
MINERSIFHFRFNTCHVLFTALLVIHSSLAEFLVKRHTLTHRERGGVLLAPSRNALRCTEEKSLKPSLRMIIVPSGNRKPPEYKSSITS